eukprot:3431627-Pleurochrysis_carterae.AAC.1
MKYHNQTSCSSCWHGLGTYENRLASVSRCHWQLCVPSRVPNGFTKYTMATSGDSAGRSACIWLHANMSAFFMASRRRATSLQKWEQLPQTAFRRFYVIPRQRSIVPSVVGESGDGMAPLIYHCPSKY